jgi:hypothetical protein
MLKRGLIFLHTGLTSLLSAGGMDSDCRYRNIIDHSCHTEGDRLSRPGLSLPQENSSGGPGKARSSPQNKKPESYFPGPDRSNGSQLAQQRP